MLKSMFVSFSFGFSFSVNFYLMALIWCAWIALEPTSANCSRAWVSPIGRVSWGLSMAIYSSRRLRGSPAAFYGF